MGNTCKTCCQAYGNKEDIADDSKLDLSKLYSTIDSKEFHDCYHLVQKQSSKDPEFDENLPPFDFDLSFKIENFQAT